MKTNSTQHAILSAYDILVLYVNIKKSVLHFTLWPQAYTSSLSKKEPIFGVI